MDQNVTARLLGFTSPEATLMFRTDPAGSFERVPLVASTEPGSFEGVLFHVEKSADYYVESNGVRSSTFKMDVVDLPTVDKLAMEYRFPAYTGLEPRTVEPGGDVAAIKGTASFLRSKGLSLNFPSLKLMWWLSRVRKPHMVSVSLFARQNSAIFAAL